jgi:hypothetical protein
VDIFLATRTKSLPTGPQNRIIQLHETIAARHHAFRRAVVAKWNWPETTHRKGKTLKWK